MPFVSNRDSRNRIQNIEPYEVLPDFSFSEQYGAALGKTTDEELSISSMLNREGWQERRQVVEERIADGQVDRSRYSNSRGRFDYNRLAEDLQDPGIKTDAQLMEARNKILAERREANDNILARGNGLAQFLGMGTALMFFDPINLATLPFSAVTTGTKSVSIIGRALLTAKREVAIVAAAESVIQPFVYEHKQDIDSPWTERDAITNILTATLFAGTLGLAGGGVSGYLAKMRKAGEENITPVDMLAAGVDEAEIETALSNMARLEDTLKQTPDINAKKVKSDFIQRETIELETIATDTIAPKRVKQLQAEQTRIEGELRDTNATISSVIESRRTPRKDLIEQRDGLSRSLDLVDRQITRNLEAKQALAELADIKAGKISPRLQERIDQAVHEAQAESEAKFLRELEDQRRVSGQPSRQKRDYEVEPVDDPDTPLPPKTTTTRQRELLDSAGLGRVYDNDIANFERIENPRIAEGDQIVDAKPFMKGLDDQIEGLEEVMRCVRGVI